MYPSVLKDFSILAQVLLRADFYETTRRVNMCSGCLAYLGLRLRLVRLRINNKSAQPGGIGISKRSGVSSSRETKSRNEVIPLDFHFHAANRSRRRFDEVVINKAPWKRGKTRGPNDRQ